MGFSKNQMKAKMNIKFTTLTGADDSTDIDKLVSLSKKYPFAEWGILFHKNKNGIPRYPSKEWIEKLTPVAKEINLSAHLCGDWVMQMRYGEIPFLKEPISNIFKRIQVNCFGEMIDQVLFSKNKFWDCPFNKPFMIGGNYQGKEIPLELFKSKGISPLFDCSGGKGILPEKWEKPLNGILCGYAGGLNPSNLEEQLKSIEAEVGDNEIWIDMETGLRNKDDLFDIDLCEQVLSIVSKNKWEKVF